MYVGRALDTTDVGALFNVEGERRRAVISGADGQLDLSPGRPGCLPHHLRSRPGSMHE
jgi:hypothetical protein